MINNKETRNDYVRNTKIVWQNGEQVRTSDVSIKSTTTLSEDTFDVYKGKLTKTKLSK